MVKLFEFFNCELILWCFLSCANWLCTIYQNYENQQYKKDLRKLIIEII